MLNALIISWFLSLGYVPTQSESIGRSYTNLETNRIATVAEIGLSAELYRLKIYGSIENYQYASGNGGFYPFRADYTAGLSFRLTDSIIFILEHECDHPVSSSPMMQGKESYMSQETRIMIKLKGEKTWK